MSEFEATISIATPVENVWNILADIGTISAWNPGVVHSEQTSAGEVAVGATRNCDLGSKNYLKEEVIEFEKPYKLTIRITETNLPFKSAVIRFHIKEQQNETLVSVSPCYELKFGWLGQLLDTLLIRNMYKKGMHDLLRGLKDYTEQQTS